MNKLFALLGHPVKHSMSPLMHNDQFKQLGINGYYHAFDICEENLKQAVEAFRVLGVSGFNVTIPHKVAIMEYLDEIDEEAQIIGAVNTVVNVNGRLVGYNTDGQGYLTSLLKELTKPLDSSNVLIIGAGGAARAVVTALANKGVQKITITNRTIENAEKIKNNYLAFKQANIDTISMKEVYDNIETYDIIINTTSIGMSPNVDEVPITIEKVKRTAVLSDLIYNPLIPKWLQQGKEKGVQIHGGVGMFVEQGALAFQKWTGVTPDTTKMTSLVLEQLGGTYVNK